MQARSTVQPRTAIAVKEMGLAVATRRAFFVTEDNTGETMSNFRVAYPIGRREARIDFPTFISLVKGTSIVSLADADDFLEFGVSENVNVRIESNHGAILQITVVSTLNVDDVPAARLQLINDDEEPRPILLTRLTATRSASLSKR